MERQKQAALNSLIMKNVGLHTQKRGEISGLASNLLEEAKKKVEIQKTPFESPSIKFESFQVQPSQNVQIQIIQTQSEKKRKGRKVTDQEMADKLLIWYQQFRSQSEKLPTRKDVMTKAL